MQRHEPKDESYRLYSFFQEGLHTLAGHDRQPLKEWKARRAAVRAHRLDFLQKLESLEDTPEPEFTPEQILIARAEVQHHLAIESTGDPEEHLQWLLAALESAQASRHPSAIWGVLMGLGHFHRMEEAYDEAVWYYKEALVYAQYGMPEWSVAAVLRWLGTTYAERDETLALAVYMFDWASRFGAEEYSALVEMQKCRLRLGEREALLREVRPPFGETCREVAWSTAALTALGRRKKALGAAAERGLQLAEESNDRGWKWAFQHILQRNPQQPASGDP